MKVSCPLRRKIVTVSGVLMNTDGGDGVRYDVDAGLAVKHN